MALKVAMLFYGNKFNGSDSSLNECNCRNFNQLCEAEYQLVGNILLEIAER